MKRIGLVGGMSWHSTAEYYRLLNEQVAAARGGHSSAKVVLESLDFAEVRDCQERGDWEASAALLAEAARGCEAGGAEVIALCTNLMHKKVDAMAAAVDVPVLHIADAVAGVARAHGWNRLLVLGTRWVMEESWYADRLAAHGIDTLVPDAEDRALVDDVVFAELTHGVVRPQSRAAYLDVIGRSVDRGAQAVVLACTEIGLLLGPDDAPVPLIDSTHAHVAALADVALGHADASR